MMIERCTGLLWIAIAVAFALLFQRQQLAWESLQMMWGQDFAFFQRILNNAAAGREWGSNLLLEPTGFLSMVHFHPIFLLLVPIWSAVGEPGLLMGINVGAVVLAALPLAWLGREASGSRWFGLLAGLAWLVWLPTHGAALADFRPMALLTPALALVAAAVWARHRGALLAGALLAMAAREESSYLLIFMGGALFVGLPFGGRRHREGLLLAVCGGLWFLFLLWQKENFFFHFNPVATLQGLGEGPSVPEELSEARQAFLLKSWLGGYLLAPLSPTPLAMSGGALAWLLGDTHREWHAISGTVVYLKDPLLPLIAAAGTAGAGAVAKRLPDRFGLLVGVGMVAGNALSFPVERQRLGERHEAMEESLSSAEIPLIWRLVQEVPADARVATDYRLIATLADRRVLWNAAHLHMEDAPPPHWEAEWPLGLERLDTLLLPTGDGVLEMVDGDWRRTGIGGGYELWRRIGPWEGPEPLL